MKDEAALYIQKAVYDLCRKIPKGKVISYKAIAQLLKSSPRAVGQALSKNTSPEVPCHRVIKSNGCLGGFNRGVKEKKRLLAFEGVIIREGKVYSEP